MASFGATLCFVLRAESSRYLHRRLASKLGLSVALQLCANEYRANRFPVYLLQTNDFDSGNCERKAAVAMFADFSRRFISSGKARPFARIPFLPFFASLVPIFPFVFVHRRACSSWIPRDARRRKENNGTAAEKNVFPDKKFG